MDDLREDDPRSLGPFTLVGRLGAGGMGVVYLARSATGVQVAVKTVPRGVGQDVRRRLQREADLLRTIEHPRIARFVDADADADEPWLAMRYVSGPSLSDAALPLPAQQLRQLADGLAEALAELHRLGVTHRDVKPGNIIMTSHGAVLVDLGIAVTADSRSMTSSGIAVGSPAWMAPEQFAGDAVGPPADVWGWAAVLAYAATGREPFGSGTLTALAHRIMTQPPDVAGVPDWLQGAVRAAFTKMPEQRPRAGELTRAGRVRLVAGAQQAGAVGSAGATSVVGPVRPQPSSRPPSAPPSAPPSRTPHPSGPFPQQAARRPARRARPWALLSGAAVLVVGLVVTLAVVLSGGSSSSTPSSPPTSGGAITVSTLKAAGLCTDGCTITGKVSFTHPRWGRVTLVSAQSSADGASSGLAYLAIFDSAGTLQWENEVGPVRTLAPVSDPVDALKHIFLTYSTGSSHGVIVLSADDSSQGVTDYGSVPIGTDASQYRFNDATVRKAADGRYEIDQDGTTYRWDGSNYSS